MERQNGSERGRGENRPRVTAGCCGWTCQCPRVGIVVVAAPECQQVLVGARDELVGRVVRASLGEPYEERAVYCSAKTALMATKRSDALTASWSLRVQNSSPPYRTTRS